MTIDRQMFAIVGAGLAGAKAAETLRSEGFDGRVVLLGPSPSGPTSGRRCRRSTCAARQNPERCTCTRRASTARTTSNCAWAAPPPTRHRHPDAAAERRRTAPYDRLLLATGAEPRRLAVPGADLDGIHYLRALADADALHAAFEQSGHLVAIGAGWIGCEIAAPPRVRPRRHDHRAGHVAAERRSSATRSAPSTATCTPSTASAGASARRRCAGGRRPRRARPHPGGRHGRLRPGGGRHRRHPGVGLAERPAGGRQRCAGRRAPAGQRSRHLRGRRRRQPPPGADALDHAVALEHRDAVAEQHLHAVLEMDVAVDRSDLRAEDALQRNQGRGDLGDLRTPARARGHLGPDPARARDDELAAGSRRSASASLSASVRG